MSFGVALHLGDMLWGNIGTADRLDFTAIGPAVNLVSRLEGLCRTLGHTVLVSGDFAAEASYPLTPLGEHGLRGIAKPLSGICASSISCVPHDSQSDILHDQRFTGFGTEGAGHVDRVHDPCSNTRIRQLPAECEITGFPAAMRVERQTGIFPVGILRHVKGVMDGGRRDDIATAVDIIGVSVRDVRCVGDNTKSKKALEIGPTVSWLTPSCARLTCSRVNGVFMP